jgi:hypothetical protein
MRFCKLPQAPFQAGSPVLLSCRPIGENIKIKNRFQKTNAQPQKRHEKGDCVLGKLETAKSPGFLIAFVTEGKGFQHLLPGMKHA